MINYIANLKQYIAEILMSLTIDIRTENFLSAEELEMLKRAELSGLAPLEAWTSQGTNRQLAYATHGMLRFFGKFPPTISSYLIQNYTDEGDLVVDPMSGSGTSGVESALLNRNCELRDVNPLMLMLARVKTTPLKSKLILDTLEKIKSNYIPIKCDPEDEGLVGLRNPLHWFNQETLNSLLGIKKLILEIEDVKLREFFLISFLGIVRRVSRATTQQGRLFLDVETAESDALPFFYKKVVDNAKALSSLPKISASLNIEVGNLTTGINVPHPPKLIILHPPYFNSYKYSSVNSLELFWLGIDHANVRKSEVREFFKVGKAENYVKFVEDMSKGLRNAYEALAPGGTIGFMMGDTAIKGDYIPVMRETLEKAALPNCHIERIALRIPKYTEASWAASQRRNSNSVGIKIYDFVVVIRKND